MATTAAEAGAAGSVLTSASEAEDRAGRNGDPVDHPGRVAAALAAARATVPSGRDGWLDWLRRWGLSLPLWALLLYIVWKATRLSWDLPPYPPDSWTYFELSQSFPWDPMRSHIFRSFISTTPYSAAFPPLWPLTIAITDVTTGTDYNAGQVAGAICMVLAAVFLDRAGHRFFGVRGCGPGALLVLLLLTAPLQEMVSAAPIAMAIMWFAAVLMIAGRPWPLTGRQAAGIGAIGGLLLLTRFDTLLIGLALPLILLAVRAIRRRQALIAYVAYGIAVSPWVVYSLVHFRTPFASDNAQITTAVDQHFVLDYLPDKVPTLRDDPGAWLTRVRGNLTGAVVPRAVEVYTEARGPLILLGLVLLGVVVSIALAVARRGPGDARSAGAVAVGELRAIATHRAVRLLVVLWAVQSVALAVALATSGYTPPRYYTTNLMLAELALGAVLLALPHKPRGSSIALTLLVAWFGFLRLGSFGGEVPLITGYPFTPAVVTYVDAITSVSACVTTSDRILFVDQAGEGYVFGALTNGEGAMQPSNWQALTPAQRQQFLQEYKLNALFVSPTFPQDYRRSRVDDVLASAGYPPGSARESCAQGLFRIEP